MNSFESGRRLADIINESEDETKGFVFAEILGCLCKQIMKSKFDIKMYTGFDGNVQTIVLVSKRTVKGRKMKVGYSLSDGKIIDGGFHDC